MDRVNPPVKRWYRDTGDITTVEEEASQEEARQPWRELKEAVAQAHR